MERGLHDQPFELSIEGEDPWVAVGPSAPLEPYAGPLTISSSTVVRAVDSDGAYAVHSYLFPDEVLAGFEPGYVAEHGETLDRTLRELPTVFLTVEQALSLSEQPVSLEWLDEDPGGPDSLHVEAGVRIVGGHSINYPKNNLRLNFRKSYGVGRWEADLYSDFASGLEPATRHDSLTLRGGSHDSVFYLGARGQYLRNRWMDESQLAMGHVVPHGRYAHVYVNLAYIGLYHVRERFGAGLLSEMLGGDEDDYEAVNSGTVVDGAGVGWAAVLAARGDYEASRELVDLQNLVDYMLLNFYAGNAWDWYPEHNWMAAGSVADGGWIFHSSDSDICLWYDPTVNILDLPGPSWIFSDLVAEGHPDFMMLLVDRIHALLEGGGPLTAEAAGARYEALSLQIEDAVVAEAARWGGGWWTREQHWEVERDHLLQQWFPARTDQLLGQLRDQGWYPLGAPVFTREGDTLRVSVPEDAWTGGVVLSLDGEDPRLPEGAIRPGTVGPAPELELLVDGSRRYAARVFDGERWGPMEELVVSEPGPSPVLLNEWNAVAWDQSLPDGDAAWGVVPGNGGPWIELLVLEPVDLSGWRLVQRDRRGRSELVFAVDERLQLLPGTLVTVARDLPEDLGYAPEQGDWRLHLRVGGELVEGSLDVSNRDWTLELLDASGRIRQLPVGEGEQLTGLGSDEVGQLRGWDPPTWAVAEGSSFGAANTWEGGEQDLGALRTLHFPGPEEQPRSSSPEDVEPASCGVAGPAGLFLFGLVLVGCRREPDPTEEEPVEEEPCYADQDGDGWGGAEVDCASPSVLTGGDCDDLDHRVSPGAAETCGGGDEDCDGLVDDEDPDVVDAMPVYEDADGDGYGGAVVLVCALGEGTTLVGGDCDDTDDATWPGAPEACDEVDSDCDGVAGGAPGQGEECPATSCLDALEQGITEDGPVWLELASGGAAPVWCDMSGGGWTLGFVRNSAATGNQGDFGAGDVGVDDLAFSPQDSSLASARMGWLDLNALEWSELRLGGYTSGALSELSPVVQRSELRLAFGEPGYLLYGPDLYWCGGPASYTDAGEGAVDNPEGAPLDCKGHGSLGSGWDFSASPYVNQGLTLCGGDGSSVMTTSSGGGWLYYGTPGGAQAIWVR